MAWVNYRQVANLFGDIEAELVRATTSLTPDGGTAEVTLLFPSWWEERLYRAACERGDEKGLPKTSAEGGREVTVRAIQPRLVKLSPDRYVFYGAFTDDHPLLWQYGEKSILYVNGPLDQERLLDELLVRLPNISRRDLKGYLPVSPSQNPPFSLTLPGQLHESVLRVLEQLAVPVFCDRTPSPPSPGVVFIVDPGYIIANDFEVNMGEFKHKPA